MDSDLEQRKKSVWNQELRRFPLRQLPSLRISQSDILPRNQVTNVVQFLLHDWKPCDATSLGAAAGSYLFSNQLFDEFNPTHERTIVPLINVIISQAQRESGGRRVVGGFHLYFRTYADYAHAIPLRVKDLARDHCAVAIFHWGARREHNYSDDARDWRAMYDGMMIYIDDADITKLRWRMPVPRVFCTGPTVVTFMFLI